MTITKIPAPSVDVITDDLAGWTKEPVEVGPGDAFIFEADFKGFWKIVEPIKKHFTIKLK